MSETVSKAHNYAEGISAVTKSLRKIEVKIESQCRENFKNLSEQETESQWSLKDCRRKAK